METKKCVLSNRKVKIKHDHEYDEAIETAQLEFRRPDGREMNQKCPYIFSSNMADAYYITAHVLYHSGKIPNAIHKSSGHSWLVDYPGEGILRVTVDKPDHRQGVNIVKYL